MDKSEDCINPIILIELLVDLTRKFRFRPFSINQNSNESSQAFFFNTEKIPVRFSSNRHGVTVSKRSYLISILYHAISHMCIHSKR